MNFRDMIKTAAEKTPYKIMRRMDANRFQAIDQTLANLSSADFRPSVVIDGGAHLGSFSLEAVKFFPTAKYHLIEPQPSCREPLLHLCQKNGFSFHGVALTDHTGEVFMSRTDIPSTGAHVGAGPGYAAVPANTLDDLLDEIAAKNCLLKLDLQGHELHALRGGIELLKKIEVIITEVSFFGQSHEPSILELMAFLHERGFQLYDIASVSCRQRDNRARQGDLVFVKANSSLVADTAWA